MGRNRRREAGKWEPVRGQQTSIWGARCVMGDLALLKDASTGRGLGSLWGWGPPCAPHIRISLKVF